jgi:hypothetical protein
MCKRVEKRLELTTKLALPEIAYMLDKNGCCETVKKNLKLSSDFIYEAFSTCLPVCCITAFGIIGYFYQSTSYIAGAVCSPTR